MLPSKYWANRNEPNKLKGIVKEEFNNYIKLHSWELGNTFIILTKEFKDQCITYELVIPTDIRFEALETNNCIIFNPNSSQKFMVNK